MSPLFRKYPVESGLAASLLAAAALTILYALTA